MTSAFQYGGPYLIAILSLLGTVCTAIYTIRRGRLDARNAYAAEILKFRLRQVSDFYAPGLLYIEQSRIVYEKLLWAIRNSTRAAVLDDFRLLDYIFEFKADPQFSALIERILFIGDNLTALISKEGALIEDGITQTYIEYQAHFEILRAASASKITNEQAAGWQEFGYYPRLLNREIHEGYKLVLRHLQDYTEAGDQIIRKLLGQKVADLSSGAQQLLENLRYYELHAEDYAGKFDTFDLVAFRSLFIDSMPKPRTGEDSKILDAGCGTGRDLIAFIKRGIEVTGVDASPALLRISKRKLRTVSSDHSDETARKAALGSRCLEMTFDEVTFSEQFDGVWASASLLHIPPSQLEPILQNLLQSLKPKGVLFMSFQYGFGQLRRGGRTFTCYDIRSMVQLLKRLGIGSRTIWLSDAQGKKLSQWRQDCEWLKALFGMHDASLWLNVLAQRNAR